MEPVVAAIIGALVAARDGWEKLGSISALISGVLVAIIGAIATYVYNSRQATAQAHQADRGVAVQRVQTVATFMPYLRSADSREKEAALLAISGLGDPELAANLASTFRDEGSVGALRRMAASPDAPAAAAARQSLDAIYAMLRHSVVKVIGREGNEKAYARGSGFAIDDGVILTADFVPANAHSLEVEMSDGQHVPCTVLATPPQSGVAVLETNHSGPPALRLARGGLGDPEEDLVLLGFGGGGWWASTGRVVGMMELPVGLEDQRVPMLRTSLESEWGHAGAPVVNRAGDVVGILWARDRETGESSVLPIDRVRAGLQDVNLAFDRHST
jgi:S1-C subfamily serine protease